MIRVQTLYARHYWATCVLYTMFIATHILTTGFGARAIVEIYGEPY